MFSRLISLYFRQVGADYLRQTVGPVLDNICDNHISLEADPDKVALGEDPVENLMNLINATESVVNRICETADLCPTEIRIVCKQVRDASDKRFPANRYSVLVALVVLRFFCPALLFPLDYQLTAVKPSASARRSLLLLAKGLQTLANRVNFRSREKYMAAIGRFVVANLTEVCAFFRELATTPAGSGPPPRQRISPQTRHKALLIIRAHLSDQLGVMMRRWTVRHSVAVGSGEYEAMMSGAMGVSS